MIDINYIGHICYDEVLHPDGRCTRHVGGAAIYGSVASAVAGASVAAELMLAPADEAALEVIRARGIAVYPVFTSQTTSVQVRHRSADMDDRTIVTRSFAGLFEGRHLHDIPARHYHLAGCNDHEFPLDFIRSLKTPSRTLSIDMQCFVRFNDKTTGEICFRDDPQKKEVAALMDKVKLDIVEARLLTGTDDLRHASQIVCDWGCPEVMITCQEGVAARDPRGYYFNRFANRSVAGRTGRGDTTFGAFLGRRARHGVEESLRFASALVSLKMEKPGIFDGTLEDVLRRMNQEH